MKGSLEIYTIKTGQILEENNQLKPICTILRPFQVLAPTVFSFQYSWLKQPLSGYD